MNLGDVKLKYVATKNNNMTRRLKNAYVVISGILFPDKLSATIKAKDAQGYRVVFKEEFGGITIAHRNGECFISPSDQSLYVNVHDGDDGIELDIKTEQDSIFLLVSPEENCLVPFYTMVQTYYLGRYDIVGPCPEHVSDVCTDYALLERIADTSPNGLVFKAVDLGIRNMLFCRLSGYHVILHRDTGLPNSPLRFMSDAGRQAGDCSAKNGGIVYRGCRVVLMSNGALVVASRAYASMVLIPDEEFSTREALEWYVDFVDNYASDAGAAEMMNRIRAEVFNRAPGNVGTRKAIANVLVSSEARGMDVDAQFALVKKYIPDATDEEIKAVAIDDLHWSELVFRKKEESKESPGGVTYLQDVSITGVSFCENTLYIDISGTVVGEPKVIPVTFTCSVADSNGQ